MDVRRRLLPSLVDGADGQQDGAEQHDGGRVGDPEEEGQHDGSRVGVPEEEGHHDGSRVGVSEEEGHHDGSRVCVPDEEGHHDGGSMGDSDEEADPLLLDGVASPNAGDEAEDYEDFLFDVGSDGKLSEDVRCGDDTTDADDDKETGSGSYDNAKFRNIVDAGDRDVLQSRYGDNMGIVTKDVYNYSSRHKRSRIIDGDTRTVLGLMVRRQRTDPDFYFDYKVDGDGRLMSMFWCDTQSCMDYQSFGDVVVFESTYRMNRYKMPFVPFVGLNHHRSTTVFGCGIVADERAETYVWLLRAFLKAMCQQKPQSIITDGDSSMMKAIRQVLPGVNHRICCWHVDKNIQKHLPSKSLKQFRKLMYYGKSENFEGRWNSFLANFQTAKNMDWLKMMHKNKELWAASFQFEKRFLGMRSNQRSESLNSSLHRHLDIYMSLLDLVEHYENCVYRLRETEADFDCRASQSLPVPLTKYRDIEVACSRVFTPANFYLLQHELLKVDDYRIFETLVGMVSQTFMLAHKEKKKAMFRVDYWTTNSATHLKCSCCKMEREGLTCSHIFHVLDHLKQYDLPNSCILQRHTKAAKGGLPSKRKSSIHGWTKKRSRYSELSVLGGEAFDIASKNHEEFCSVKEYLGGIISKKHRIDSDDIDGQSTVDQNDHTGHTAIGSVCDPVVAATKGAPKKNIIDPVKENNAKQNNVGKKRIKSFGEKRQYKCSACKKGGHNKQTCKNEQLELTVSFCSML